MRLPLTVLSLLLIPLDVSAGTPLQLENGLLEPYGPPAPPPVSQPAPPAPKLPPCNRFDLHSAVWFPKTDCLQAAIRHMDVNDVDVNGDTPLHNAIHADNGAAVRFLLRNGADPHQLDFHGQNAIALASGLGHDRMADFLRAVEREDERLLEAVENDDVVGVSNSLQRGATLGMRDVRLDTILHRAAESDLVDIGRLLVHHGASLDARNYLGETPLHAAALRGFKDFMKMLIEAGANVNALDERRRTPLDIAELQSDPEILKLLEKRKARRGTPASVEFDLTGGEGEYAGDTGSPGR